MKKVICVVALALTSLTAQARTYDVNTCGEVAEMGKRLMEKHIEADFAMPMDEAMDAVVAHSIKTNGHEKKGQAGYTVQQALFFLQENWAIYSVRGRYNADTLKDTAIAAMVTGTQMSTLCFEQLNK